MNFNQSTRLIGIQVDGVGWFEVPVDRAILLQRRFRDEPDPECLAYNPSHAATPLEYAGVPIPSHQQLWIMSRAGSWWRINQVTWISGGNRSLF